MIFEPSVKKQPYTDGTFYKSLRATEMTEAFKKLHNPEIEKLKRTEYGVSNLGPGVSQLAVDTFRLLKPSPKVVLQTEDRINKQKQNLNSRVNELIRQREEFENQIKQYNADRERDLKNKLDMQKH